MALDLTDTELDALAERARQILNAPSKQDAVRQALERVVEKPIANSSLSSTTSRPVGGRLKELQDRLQKMGTPNPDFDDKAFLDEMWET